MNSVLEIIAPRKLLLMIDEYDILQKGIESGVTGAEVPDNIRSIINHSNIGAIITVTGKIKKIRRKYWDALYAIGGVSIDVSSLAKDDAARVVVHPPFVSYQDWIASGSKPPERTFLSYDKNVVEEIVRNCDNQPFLIQGLCLRIFNLAKKREVSIVDNELMRSAYDEFAKESHFFDPMWDQFIENHFQRFLLMLVEENEYVGTNNNPDPASIDLLQYKLKEASIPVEPETIQEAIDDLRDLELIRFIPEKGGHYIMRVPLMGKWIHLKKDFKAFEKLARMHVERSY